MATVERYDEFENTNFLSKVTRNYRKLLTVGAVVLIVGVVAAIVTVLIISRMNKPSDKPGVLTGDETVYFESVTKLTNGGVNAEAYWSLDNSKIIFQGIREGFSKCDQIFSMNPDGSDVKMLSNGKGKTTCAYFMKDMKTFIYSSTMDIYGEGCPPEADKSFGYTWAVYNMNMYLADATTGQILKNLTQSKYYEAEGTLSPDGKKIIYTSTKDGDLELYTMDIDGSNIKRLTYTPGYDGGAFYSHKGDKIVWRANRPRGADLTNYLTLLSLGLVEPVNYPMDIFIMNSDGTGQRKLSKIGGANFAPSFLPDDSGIIFASNQNHGNPAHFHLYVINVDGTNLRRITTQGTFNLFPHFSYDGQYLIWSSNRESKSPHEMDIHKAKWKDVIKSV
jgi:Tol biopolymer transport system component